MQVNHVKALTKEMVDFPFLTFVVQESEDSCLKVAVAAELYTDGVGPGETNEWGVLIQGEHIGVLVGRIYLEQNDEWLSNEPVSVNYENDESVSNEPVSGNSDKGKNESATDDSEISTGEWVCDNPNISKSLLNTIIDVLHKEKLLEAHYS